MWQNMRKIRWSDISIGKSTKDKEDFSIYKQILGEERSNCTVVKWKDISFDGTRVIVNTTLTKDNTTTSNL